MAEAVATKHPDYLERADEWRLMRDAIWGETKVKEAATRYLPMPSGFKVQDDGGQAMYCAYQTRAQVPEITAPAVQAMVGVIHQAEIKIEMPDALSGLWERATVDGLPLEVFHRRVTAELLSTGRFAILVDAASDGGAPYFSGYQAEALINWADDRSMFVLDECGLVRDGFQWTQQDQFLALTLEDGKFVGTRYDAAGNVVPEASGSPTTAKRQALDEIPFVVMGPRDLSLCPETPPLIGVARSAVSMYQLSADYRWQLFMSGQETLFVINADAPSAIGAGVVVALKGGDAEKQPDAKYVGPAGAGIEAHRLAIQDESKKAAAAGAKLFESGSGEKAAESGDALRIRFAAETASLVSIAHASCAGLEKALRYAGRLLGLSDAEVEKIVVTPPASLVEHEMTPEEMGGIMGLWEKGLISGETAYERLQAGGVASPERDWKAEKKLIDDEDMTRAEDARAAVTPPAPAPAA